MQEKLDKATAAKLKRYAQVFKDAHEKGANESDTVMYLIKFFEDVLGYDSLAGEITKEVSIKERFCDFGVKLSGTTRFLVEGKAAGNKGLRDKDIEQAENYASRSGLRWVLLSNGIEWRLYHVTFSEGEGINHEIAFSINFVEECDSKIEELWSVLQLLSKSSFERNGLDEYWSKKKMLAPTSLLRVLFSEAVLTVVRRELNRTAEARLESNDVFNAIKDVISKEVSIDALLEEEGITPPGTRKRRRRRKVHTVDATTGKVTEVEEETDEEEPPVNTQQKPTDSGKPVPENEDTLPEAR